MVTTESTTEKDDTHAAMFQALFPVTKELEVQLIEWGYCGYMVEGGTRYTMRDNSTIIIPT